MRFSALQAAVVALGAAQPAVADLHGHRTVHQHYGKRSAHNHAAAAVHGQNNALLEHRAAAPSQPEARQPQPDSASTLSLPELFRRDAAAAAPRDEPKAPLKKRAVCSLPDHPDLVAVPGAQNGGWAMAPDVECTAGSWCPIACVSGKVMAQWKPGTSYTYPESMDGGLYCDESGTPSKGFDDQPYCVDGTGTVSAENRCGSVVSFCQTVLPGDEGMYIPTDVTGTSVLAVPGPSYWASTAAHYYINPPGTSGKEGCVWGTDAEPIGNWSPYVAGANTDDSGSTFVKLGWNPIYTSSGLTGTKPTYGLRIECSSGDCNGLPCEIGADNMDDFSVKSSESAAGAGGADFCVATVPKGGSATIVVFNLDGSSSDGDSSGDSSSSSENATTSATPTPSPSPTPTTSSTTSSSSTSTSTSTTSSSSTSSSTTFSSSSSSSSSSSTSSSAPPSSTSSSWSWSSPSSSSAPSSSDSSTKTSTHRTTTKTKPTSTTLAGAIFQENGTDSTSAAPSSTVAAPSTTAVAAVDSATAAKASQKSDAANGKKSGAVVGLLVAIVAGLWLY